MNNGKTIMVQEHCLALPAMVVFAGSILFFTGSWKNKLWFIPLGLLFVVVINTVRLVLVCLTFQYASLLVYHLHHSFIYVILTYALILLMIYWWMSKFADVPVRKNN